MKLLVYSHSFVPNFGGIETIVLSLTRGLAELRTDDGKPQFDLKLATNTAPNDFPDQRLVPFPVIRQPSMVRLWELIREADLIHLAGPALWPLLLARMARKPVVIEHHGYQAICPNGLLVHQPDRNICPGYFQAGRYGKCLECQACEMSWLQSAMHVLAMFPRHLLARRAARNVAISQHELQRLALPSTVLVYHGVEDLPHADTALGAFAADAEKICFAYVGRLVPEKGLPTLLKAAEMLKQAGRSFRILLIGDGPERAKLESNIDQRGLSGLVRCTGFLQGAALAEVIRGVHVVIMPSAWEETAGLAAMEQMMRSRLVVAARIGGLGEIVGDAGLTFATGSAEQLAKCIEDIIRDPQLIPMMGNTARKRARAFFLAERMVAEHARLFDEVFREGRNGRAGQN
jgi:glycogen(starch) synthase